MKISKETIHSIITNPWLSFLGIGIGIALGIYAKDFALLLEPVGSAYLAFLQMCGFPLIICAVISSLGNMLKGGKAGRFIARLSGIAALLLVILSFIAILAGSFSEVGKNLDEESSAVLGKMLLNADLSKSSSDSELDEISMTEFLVSIVPKNVFSSMSSGDHLPILFFCILIGVALGLSRSTHSTQTIDFFSSLYSALMQLIEWSILIAPIGLLALFAAQVAQIGISVFTSMFKFVAVYYLVAIGIMIMGFFVISIKKHISPFKVFHSLSKCLIISFATKSSVAAMPAALQAMKTDLGADKKTSDLALPLGINLAPLGNTIYYILGTFFIAQLFGVELAVSDWPIIILAGVFASIAGSSMPGAAAISVFAILFIPLGLPLEAAVVLILAVDPIIDPITTVINVQGSCVMSSLVETNDK